jgi:radical SAM superfamily enzyme YgiQ (UPF0313 family)
LVEKKFGLIHLGNDESYGLIFVAGELTKEGHNIRWFDGDSDDLLQQVNAWEPDFIFFSPLTTFFKKSLTLSKKIKELLPNVRSIFGGHHVFAEPNSIELEGVDLIVQGSIYSTIDKIINSTKKEVIKGILIPTKNMIPSRREYYEAIPRMANRHRKYIMSHFGCVYNCSYCSNSRVRKFYGAEIYLKHCFDRREIKDLISEAKIFLDYPTKEVSLEDDDILSGPNIEQWLEEFASAWKKEIGLPTYANVTPLTVVKVSDNSLKILAGLVNSVQMGVQTARYESLKLFNRLAQNEEIVKAAYDRLTSFGIPVKMEFILGLPVKDPVGDAIASIKLAQKVGAGTFISAFPLMIYPGTDLNIWCKENNIEFNDECTSEWHTGIGSIKFDPITTKRIINLTKMATMFVKYNINERWMRALIDMNITPSASKGLSKCQYLESLIFRLGKDTAEKEFEKIITEMDFKY